MMRKTAVLILAGLMSLSGCFAKEYGLSDGRYVLKQTQDEAVLPYLLINNDKLTVIRDIAVSYQPSGTVSRKGNEIIMTTKYAGNDYQWVFSLTDDDTLAFSRIKSSVPAGWEDGMIFVKAEE